MHFARWKFRRVQPANPTVLMKKHLRPAIWQDSEITAGFKMPEPSEAIFFWESWWSNFAIPHFTPSLKTINSTSRWMDCLIQRRSVYICWLVISSLRYSFCNPAGFVSTNSTIPSCTRRRSLLRTRQQVTRCSTAWTTASKSSLHSSATSPRVQATCWEDVMRRVSWREDKKFIPWSFGPTNFTAPFLYFVCNYPFYSYLFGSIFCSVLLIVLLFTFLYLTISSNILFGIYRLVFITIIL